jgi:putative transposase
MAQSLSYLLVHVVFSTKDREPLILPAFRDDLHAYLATVARNTGCDCYRVGGMADHVHLALKLSRTLSIAQLIETLKTSSTKWFKTQSPILANFAWQNGYGAFSVGPTNLQPLVQYIENQESHHTKRTFQEELRAFLNEYGIDDDEGYLWT